MAIFTPFKGKGSTAMIHEYQVVKATETIEEGLKNTLADLPKLVYGKLIINIES